MTKLNKSMTKRPMFKNLSNSTPVALSYPIQVEIPKEHYRSIQPKQTPLYPINGNPSLVIFGDYK